VFETIKEISRLIEESRCAIGRCRRRPAWSAHSI